MNIKVKLNIKAKLTQLNSISQSICLFFNLYQKNTKASYFFNSLTVFIYISIKIIFK